MCAVHLIFNSVDTVRDIVIIEIVVLAWASEINKTHEYLMQSQQNPRIPMQSVGRACS